MIVMTLPNSRLPIKSLLLLAVICIQAWLSLHFFPQMTAGDLPLDEVHGSLPSEEKNNAVPKILNLEVEALRQLPSTDERIDRFHHIASTHNIKIKRINYQRIKMPGQLIRIEMQAELSGSYPAIRNFLRGIDAKDPAIAIDGVAFSRDSANAEVKAQIKFLLYAAPTPITDQVVPNEQR
jgi:hypothetical protein